MRVLALNPFHIGSHKAFLEGWVASSRHDWTVLSLPGRNWKWRMRHAAITFAKQLTDCDSAFDAIFTTDMLNVAEFRGLAKASIGQLPTIVYFHENQLTYPASSASVTRDDRDLHFAFTNLTTALAADAVWFNSHYHRDVFLQALEGFLQRVPDHAPDAAAAEISRKSSVRYPPIDVPNRETAFDRGCVPTICWVSRWEHDKDPETFFAALRLLLEAGREFRLRVLGESFRKVPPCFESAQIDFRDQIDHWGFVDSRAAYLKHLQSSDIVVSTARHEFFGIAVLEAVASGCVPVVPSALAYPEVLAGHRLREHHDGSAQSVAAAIQRADDHRCSSERTQSAKLIAEDFNLRVRVSDLDDQLELAKHK